MRTIRTGGWILSLPLHARLSFDKSPIVDTAFRIFIPMTCRRLDSDKYFTTDFNTAIYPEVRMNWVQNTTTMIDALLRHHPELCPAIRGVTNTFQPRIVVTVR